MGDALLRGLRPLLEGSDRLLDRVSAATGDASRTVKYLAGRARFVPRASDVYVASYPRSGTTWTQLIVHLLVTGATGLDFNHLSEVSPWFERSLAWRTGAADAFARLPAPRVFKTHLPYRWLPGSGRCLHVVRDPGDVVVSYYHLYRRYLGWALPFDAFFERFLAGEVQYRSYFDHLAGWRAAPEGRVLEVSYEALRADPAFGVRRIASFLEVPVDDARVEAVVDLTGFERMKAEEHKLDHLGELARQRGATGGTFVRAGRVARGAGTLSDTQRAALDRALAGARRPRPKWHLPAFLH